MMLAFARQFPQSLLDQQTTRGWRSAELRTHCDLLGPDQTVLLLGFGAISRRLVELFQPFGLKVIATRRRPRGDEPIPAYPDEQTDALLGQADHVIDVLPDNASTTGFMTADRFARMRPTAFFYNIGRGTTVRQDDLIAALYNKQIAGAYLDVTDPEPLPPDHLLWRAPNCFITPHTGGGHHDEFERMVKHFLANLERFERGERLADRVI
jgi:phosphoglycerate dehydrogenase-like enzyme